MSQVLSEIDRRHATAADLPLDGVAVREGGFEAVEGVGQDCDLGLEVLLRCGMRAQVASADVLAAFALAPAPVAADL